MTVGRARGGLSQGGNPMIRKVLVGAAAAMSAVLALSACTTSLTVDKATVEEKIQTSLGPQISAPIESVSCPEDLKGEVGATMDCTMTVSGEDHTVRVTVTTVEGTNVNFDMQTV